MFTVSNTTGRISGLRRGILFLLTLAMMATLFGTVLAVPADAASYKVKAWTSGDMHCYTVYKGSLPKMYEPTFYRYDDDVYKSGNMKISFYWQYDSVDEDQLDAFYKYLGDHSKASSWTRGIYHFDVNDGSGTVRAYYPYKIEGWRCDKESTDKLLRFSPLTNSDGTKLYLEYIGRGDLRSTKWNEIRNVRECSTAIYFKESDATIGFRFVDRYGSALYLYCP